MKLRIYFKHMPSSGAIESYAQEKLGDRLEKYHLDLVEAHLTVAVENADYVASCHVVGARGTNLNLTCVDKSSMNAAIDALADKVDARLRRAKEKLHSHRDRDLAAPDAADAPRAAPDLEAAGGERDAVDAGDIPLYERARSHPKGITVMANA